MNVKKSNPEYKYAFNKVFTGKYLIYNLGNELINFLKTDNDERLVYLNPYGNRCREAAEKTKYVLHIMESSYDNKKCYELVAISKILEKNVDGKIENKTTSYNEKDTVEERAKYENLKFGKHCISDIFNDSKSHLCSFFAEELLEPKENIRIFFKGNKKNIPKNLENTHPKNGTNDIFIIPIKSNLSGARQLCYSRKADLHILDELVKSKEYLESKNNTINSEDIEKIKDEQCFAALCDRTRLENSMSNQIAYFLRRNKEFLKKFIELLNSKNNKDTNAMISTDEMNFKISREHNKIDILLESDNDIIVIENKIDSSINGNNKKKKSKAKNTNSNCSQLSKYYKYITEDYEILTECENKSVKKIKAELKENGFIDKIKSTTKKGLIKELKKNTNFRKYFNKKKKHFFILKPDYNPINEETLKNYTDGKEYKIITYTELYEKLKPCSYDSSIGVSILQNALKNIQNLESKFLHDQFIQSLEKDLQNALKNIQNLESEFLYDQFIQSLEYVKSSKAEQMRKTAYIRLKQRLKELDNENSNN